MQIVINIHEDVYEDAKNNIPNGLDQYSNEAIRNGIPLPKGHGDLIDRNYFIDKYAGYGNVYCEDTSCEDCNSRIVNKFDVDSAPAIIPADNGEVD